MAINKTWIKDKCANTRLKAIIVLLILFALFFPLMGCSFVYQYNKNQLIISREKNISDIMRCLSSEEVDSQKMQEIILTLPVFKESAIPALISFLNNEDPGVRETSALAIEMIGKKSVGPLSTFLLSEFVYARFKGEAMRALQGMDPVAFDRIKTVFVNKMSKNNFSSDTEIDYNKNPFIAPATIIAFYKLGIELNGVYLPQIVLSFENLEGISLKNADLREADFHESTLTNAIFEEANMEGVDLDGAIIRNANFRKTKLKNAILLGVIGFEIENFSGAKGIEDRLNTVR